MHTTPANISNISSSSPANSALTAVTGFAANTSFNVAMREANAALRHSNPADARSDPQPTDSAEHPDNTPPMRLADDIDEPLRAQVEQPGKARLKKPLSHSSLKAHLAAPDASAAAEPNTALAEILRMLPAAEKKPGDGAGDPAIQMDAQLVSGAAEQPVVPGTSLTVANIVATSAGQIETAIGDLAATDAGGKAWSQKSRLDTLPAPQPTDTLLTSSATRLPADIGVNQPPNVSNTSKFSDPIATTNKETAGVISPARKGGDGENKLTSSLQSIDAISQPQRPFDQFGANSAGVQTALSVLAPQAQPNSQPNPPFVEVTTQLGQPGWLNELGSAVIKLTDRNISEAKLKINPEHLGPIEVLIDLNGSAARVSFVAATPEARQALEQSLPQLAQMMSDAGLSLAQTSVGQGDHNGSHNMTGSQPKPVLPTTEPAQSPGQEIPVPQYIRARLGGIDTFA